MTVLLFKQKSIIIAIEGVKQRKTDIIVVYYHLIITVLLLWCSTNLLWVKLNGSGNYYSGIMFCITGVIITKRDLNYYQLSVLLMVAGYFALLLLFARDRIIKAYDRSYYYSHGIIVLMIVGSDWFAIVMANFIISLLQPLQHIVPIILAIAGIIMRKLNYWEV